MNTKPSIIWTECGKIDDDDMEIFNRYKDDPILFWEMIEITNERDYMIKPVINPILNVPEPSDIDDIEIC